MLHSDGGSGDGVARGQGALDVDGPGRGLAEPRDAVM